ncbi:MAG: amidohydrolase [Planctomycetota bacterium]|nr:amidohydrolase [Planctomycetota bacterium]
MMEKVHQIREELHAHPEISNREEKTAEYIARHLEEAGLEVTRGIAHTGVIGILKGGKPGPVVAARADMDALPLPVPESTGFPFASNVTIERGGEKSHVMHACGHDVHMAIGLGTAMVLAARKDELPGTVKFIFQPAEEGPPPGEDGGAGMMEREGVLKDPDVSAIFALHVWPDLDVGTIGYNAGGSLAAVERIRIKIIGKQTHAAYPWKGVDPIVLASQAILALQTIHSRQVDAREPSIITIGVIRGGSRWNIIPGDVVLEGTVRTYSEETRADIRAKVERTLKGVTESAGGTYQILEYSLITPVTVNDPDLTEKSVPSLEKAAGKENVVKVLPTLGGEDFAYFARKVPGFYFRLGVRPKGQKDFPPLHSPNFGPDAGSLEVGVKAMVQLLDDYLIREGRE